MTVRESVLWSALAAALFAFGQGCDKAATANEPSAGGASVVAPAVEANHLVGKVTMEDGAPLQGDIKDVTITIRGVTEAGERVTFVPVVKPNGTFRQKVPAGQYSFSTSKVAVHFQNVPFTFALEPVGNNWSKNQDASEGIEQNFVWKVTGPTPRVAGLSDVNNHTHWYGMSVGMQFSIYRSDKKQASVAPPEGTKLVFTVTPTSLSIDGRELKPVTIERVVSPNATQKNDDLNDLVPAIYDIVGVAVLPDGSSKPLLFQGAGNYPNYVTTLKAPLQNDALIGGMSKQLVTWVVE